MGRPRGLRKAVAVQPSESPFANHTLYTRDVAALTGWTSANVRLLSREGKLPFIWRGGYRLYNREEVLAYATACRRAAPAPAHEPTSIDREFDDLGI